MINIIGGLYKGKKIKVPERYVRATSAMKREAIFAILESYALKNNYDLYKNKCFIDLYAGSGSVGLEAISRGMSFTYFYEINNQVYKNLEENCLKICKKNQFAIYKKDSSIFNDKKFTYPVSVIFIDPPYKLNPFKILLDSLLNKKILNDNSIVIIEAEKDTSININKKYIILKEKIYGKTKIIFLKKL